MNYYTLTFSYIQFWITFLGISSGSISFIQSHVIGESDDCCGCFPNYPSEGELPNICLQNSDHSYNLWPKLSYRQTLVLPKSACWRLTFVSYRPKRQISATFLFLGKSNIGLWYQCGFEWLYFFHFVWHFLPRSKNNMEWQFDNTINLRANAKISLYKRFDRKHMTIHDLCWPWI